MKMNQKKKGGFSSAMLVLLLLTAVSLGATGIFHTVMKNRQLQVVRQIEKVERRVKEKERDVINLEIRINQLENRYDMRNALIAGNTSLRGIPLESIVDISATVALPEMASNY